MFRSSNYCGLDYIWIEVTCYTFICHSARVHFKGHLMQFSLHEIRETHLRKLAPATKIRALFGQKTSPLRVSYFLPVSLYFCFLKLALYITDLLFYRQIIYIKMTRKATNFDQKWTKSDQNLSKETKKDQNEPSLKK